MTAFDERDNFMDQAPQFSQLMSEYSKIIQMSTYWIADTDILVKRNSNFLLSTTII